jgi:DNA-binding transcriptional MerR regulator
MTTIKIGEVAEQTGLSIHTLRYYEQIGLVSPISREGNGHRTYSEDDVYRIMFVLHLRSAGMPVANIRRYVELAQQGDEAVVERLDLLEAHQAAVEQKIAHYREFYKAALAESLAAQAVLETPL